MTKAMKVSKGDLAALLFHSRDVVSQKTRYLENRELDEGAVVTITMVARVTRTPGGGLIFGDFTGDADHRG